MLFNNTLAGRLLVGPAIGTLLFIWEDAKHILAGDKRVLVSWVYHVPAVTMVVVWIAFIAEMPVSIWLVTVYLSLSILKIRTFLEHRAHLDAKGRTVIVEDRGILALIFLNNNLHVVHHMHAAVPWYRLPRLYWENTGRYLERNHGYRYKSYREIMRRYFWKSKDPVPHPLLPKS